MAAETTTTEASPPRAPAPERPSNPFSEAALRGLPKVEPGGPTSAELEAELWGGRSRLRRGLRDQSASASCSRPSRRQ